MLVGVVHAAGTRVCDAAGNERWINRHQQIGFTRVTSAKPLPAGSVPVVAHGRPLAEAPIGTEPMPDDAAPCPQAQMRDDWVETPEGMRVRRGGGPGLAAFAVDRVVPFAGLTATLEGDDALRVRFENTLDRTLEPPVEIIVHYEGCYGKPGATSRAFPNPGGLVPGAAVEETLPTFDYRERVRGRGVDDTARHRASSIEVRAKGANVHFDFDVDLDALGVKVECDER